MNKLTNHPIPFSVYQISRNYIDYLRKSDPYIMNPEKTTTYCGPVGRITGKNGSLDLFIPIDIDFYNMNDAFALTFVDGVLANMMDFTIMIPCSQNNCALDTSNEDLTVFCQNNERLIKKCAKIVAENSRKTKNRKEKTL